MKGDPKHRVVAGIARDLGRLAERLCAAIERHPGGWWLEDEVGQIVRAHTRLESLARRMARHASLDEEERAERAGARRARYEELQEAARGDDVAAMRARNLLDRLDTP